MGRRRALGGSQLQRHADRHLHRHHRRQQHQPRARLAGRLHPALHQRAIAPAGRASRRRWRAADQWRQPCRTDRRGGGAADQSRPIRPRRVDVPGGAERSHRAERRRGADLGDRSPVLSLSAPDRSDRRARVVGRRRAVAEDRRQRAADRHVYRDRRRQQHQPRVELERRLHPALRQRSGDVHRAPGRRGWAVDERRQPHRQDRRHRGTGDRERRRRRRRLVLHRQPERLHRAQPRRSPRQRNRSRVHPVPAPDWSERHARVVGRGRAGGEDRRQRPAHRHLHGRRRRQQHQPRGQRHRQLHPALPPRAERVHRAGRRRGRRDDQRAQLPGRDRSRTGAAQPLRSRGHGSVQLRREPGRFGEREHRRSRHERDRSVVLALHPTDRPERRRS